MLEDGEGHNFPIAANAWATDVRRRFALVEGTRVRLYVDQPRGWGNTRGRFAGGRGVDTEGEGDDRA